MGPEHQRYMPTLRTNKLLPRRFHDSVRSDHYRPANTLAAESQDQASSQGWRDLPVSTRILYHVLLRHAPYANPDNCVR